MDEQPSGESEPRGSNLAVPIAVVAAGIIIAAAVVYVGGFGRKSIPQPSVGSIADGVGKAGPAVDDDPSLGDPGAKVTIIEFADFQCPFCNRFFRETMPQIIERYVKTGKVRFVYRDFPFLGDESKRAAEAAECADDQGKFWSYHDSLYNFVWDDYFDKGNNGENAGAFSPENLKRLAAGVGLDSGDFAQCVNSGRNRSEVERDFADGQAAGVSGTPTSFVNGKAVVGAVSFELFEAEIEAALVGK